MALDRKRQKRRRQAEQSSQIEADNWIGCCPILMPRAGQYWAAPRKEALTLLEYST
jgi:hypothetical protein